MSSLEPKKVAADHDDDDIPTNRTNEDGNPPPPYQEGVGPSTLSSSQCPSACSLRVQYDEGKFPSRVRVFEKTNNLGGGQHSLYWAKLHSSKIIGGGAHMEFKKTIASAPSSSSSSALAHDAEKKTGEEKGEDIGSAKFHKLGKMRVDLKFRDGESTTMTGYSGTTYAIMNFTSFASIGEGGAAAAAGGSGQGRQLRWKRPGQGLSLVLVDPQDDDSDKNTNQKGLASMHFQGTSSPVGEIVIFDEDLARNERLVEEILISGLAYVHLFRFLPSYAGGASSIGLGVGAV